MGAASNDSTMKVSKEEMKRAGIDLAYRDFCAHLLIPLNECRRKSFFLPWKCGDERHAYEKCQYEECAIASSSTNASNFFLIFVVSCRRRFLFVRRSLLFLYCARVLAHFAHGFL